MSTSRVRLWASGTSHQTFTLCAFETEDSDPVRRSIDRLGLVHESVPTGTGEDEAWAIRGELVFPARLCYQLSSDNDPLHEWLDTYARQAQTEFYLFAESRGTDSGGGAVDEKKYYKSRLGPLPKWLLGLRTGFNGSMPKVLTLNLVNITDEGTFSDFDSIASITSRGARPV